MRSDDRLMYRSSVQKVNVFALSVVPEDLDLHVHVHVRVFVPMFLYRSNLPVIV